MSALDDLNVLVDDEFSKFEKFKKEALSLVVNEFSITAQKVDLSDSLVSYCFSLMSKVKKLVDMFDELENFVIQYNQNRDEKILIKINNLKDKIGVYIDQNIRTD